jgi:hypothetical protein
MQSKGDSFRQIDLRNQMVKRMPSKFIPLHVRADCLATNTEYCDRCTHAATQATNVARIKTEGTKGLLQGQVAG